MTPTRIETLVGPDAVTLYFCGNEGCAHQLQLRPSMLSNAASTAPMWTCPMHGHAVGPMRSVEYVRKAASS